MTADPGPRYIVVIPARDESERLEGALSAIERAAAATSKPVALLVLANNCTDETAAFARHIAVGFDRCVVEVTEEHLPSDRAHAGGARQRAFARALRTFNASEGDILVSTDADARLRGDAFRHMDRAFEAGAQVVLAKLESMTDPLDPVADHAVAWGRPGLLWRCSVRRFVETVRSGEIASSAVHDDYGGAGIAICVEAYNALGGFPPIPCHEDLWLVRAADAAAMSVNRQSGVIVDVLARATGRARGGMADTLARFGAAATENIPCLVEHHSATIRRVFRNPTHANAFPARITEWEPASAAIAGLERAIASFVGDAG
ncbi:MAG: glycosyltransferase family 2 protein [Hyphomicrobiaceae bacterium]